MGISTLTDTIYTYRFLKLLVTPFDQMEAYKFGIIDANGKRIKDKKITTGEERDSFNLFHRIVFNLKRLLGAFPGGKSKIASYAAALGLLREHYDVDIDIIMEEMKIDEEYKSEICSLLEEYEDDDVNTSKKKKKCKDEEYGTTTGDVANIPKPMKFKSFVKRKDLELDKTR